MVVDGMPNVRTCVTPLAAGMDVRTQYGVSLKRMDAREHEVSVENMEARAQQNVSVTAETTNEIEGKGR